MKKLILITLTVFSLFFGVTLLKNTFTNVQVQAATCPTGYTCYDGCEYSGQCVNNKKCGIVAENVIGHPPGPAPCGSAIIGGVKPPKGVDSFNFQVRDGTDAPAIGILVFASKLLKLVNIVAGLLVFANFALAGYTFITSAGKTNLYLEIQEKLTFSIIGLVIVVVAYTGAAIFGYIFFGDATIILNPDLTKYGALAPPAP